MAKEAPKRKRSRPDGELSRGRILDAATEIAAERGYEGTSIALVSAKCGLPASSIYWHFKDKDDLIAAVIERSFVAYQSVWEMSDTGPVEEQLHRLASRVAEALGGSPDFLRLGLMLALERRPTEVRARTMFVEVRAQAFERLMQNFQRLLPDLSTADIRQLATYAMAGADGLFIAHEIGGETVDIKALLDLHARSIYDTARRMMDGK